MPGAHGGKPRGDEGQIPSPPWEHMCVRVCLSVCLLGSTVCMCWENCSHKSLEQRWNVRSC